MSHQDPGPLYQFGFYTALITQMAMSLVGGVLLGYYLDGYLDTAPLLIVLGTVIGMAVSIRNLFQMVKHFRSRISGPGRQGE